MMTPEHDAVVRLSQVNGLGPVRIAALVRAFESAQSALEASPEEWARVPGLRPADLSGLDEARRMDTTPTWRLAERCGTRAALPDEPEYPDRLKQIHDPPPILWFRGTPAAPAARLVAVVGTRRATPYGRANARALAGELVEAGIGVVSGLALGIDGEAHAGALDAGGWTGAVLGCGIDRVYPPAHRALARRVLESGAIYSELLPGSPSRPENFPKRNRIISGMCSGTVVVEAHEKGGALITARLALEQDREVFAVPGPVSSPASAGAHRLIRENTAKLVSRFSDVIGEIWPEPAVPAPIDDLGDTERRLLAAIGPVATTLDAVCDATSIDISTALVHLLDLEFRGFVLQMAGRQLLRTTKADRVAAWTGPPLFVS